MNLPQRLTILVLLFLATILMQSYSQDLQLPEEEVLTLWKKARPRGPPRFGKRSSTSKEVLLQQQQYGFPYLNNLVLLDEWQQPAHIQSEKTVVQTFSKSDERKFLELLAAVRNSRRHMGDHLFALFDHPNTHTVNSILVTVWIAMNSTVVFSGGLLCGINL